MPLVEPAQARGELREAGAARVEQGGGALQPVAAREEASTLVTGDRFASIYDPFGHRWAIMTRVEDIFAEEADRRLAEWGAQQVQE